jgi:hypothetical protein
VPPAGFSRRVVAIVSAMVLTSGLVAACGDETNTAVDPCLTSVPSTSTTSSSTTSTTTTTTLDASSTTIDPCPPDDDTVPEAAPAPTPAPEAAATVPTTAPSSTAPSTVATTDTSTTTTVPEADPRGRRFGYDGQIGVFPVAGEFCVPVAEPITIRTPPDATFDPSTFDPSAPSEEVVYEVEITFDIGLPTTGKMRYFIAAGGATFQGTGTYVIDWSNFGVLEGTMRLSDDAATATAGPNVVDDTMEEAGIFKVTEVGTC